MVAVIGSSWFEVDKGLLPLQRNYAARRYTRDAHAVTADAGNGALSRRRLGDELIRH
jgi:hypothetical protein